MTLKQVLSRARIILTDNNVEDASLECELLLRYTLRINRVQLYLDLDHEISPEQEKNFWHLVERRVKGEPAAYITGYREFYGCDFHVGPDVLIPRPESELLVEKALHVAQNYTIPAIADIGTGSGAIAISLALNLPQAKIYATDISAQALEVTGRNCRKYGVTNRIILLQGDMLNPLPEPVDIIVANLPYVRESEMNTDRYEPALALDGGSDGLDKIRHLCCQLAVRAYPADCLLLEIGLGQSGAVTVLLRSLFPSARLEITPDLSGIERIVSLILDT